LSGIVAGLLTTTNEIGYVAAFNISEVNRGINAFTMGVRLVNPDATVHVEWCGSWTDDNMAAAATNKLIESHNIDVLTMHTDSLAPLEVAEKNKIWSIGYNTDNSSLFPDTYLTAPVWEWEYFYKQRIEECKYNQFTGKHYWEGMETGVVSLAPFTDNVKPEISAIVENEKKRIETGTYDVFYGPIRDNKGNLRIKDGESMTDDEMLNAFDWFVEGVKICE